MFKNRLFRKENLKRVLLVTLTLLIILSISEVILSEVIKAHPDTMQTSITKTFNNIKNQLEFEGLSQATKNISRNYSDLFNGSSNIIITNDAGNILYNYNTGYISGNNKFSVLIDPWKANEYGSDIAYLIDNKNKIKYSAQLDISLNMNNLKEQSSKNPLSKVLFARTTEYENIAEDKEIVTSDGSSYVVSSETKLLMDYEYIGSKGLNLFAIYDSDHQFNNYYYFVNLLQMFKRWILLLMLGILVISLGLGICLLYRAKYSSSKIDKQKIAFTICPHCGEKIEAENENKNNKNN